MMKVLEIDIETAPHIAYIWSLWDQNVPIDRLVTPGYTLCFAARWQHEKTIRFYSIWTIGERAMLKAAWALLDEADAVIHYNGKKFDIPTLNREFVLKGMIPPSPYQEIDLLSVVKRRFKFASNKLDFVCQQLGLGAKVQHKGMQLWRGVMDGNGRDQATMERYNRVDVRLLGALYKALQPWIPQHPNRGLWVEDAEHPVCRNCGSQNIKRNGMEARYVLKYHRFRCKDCGANLRGRFNVASDRHSNVLI